MLALHGAPPPEDVDASIPMAFRKDVVFVKEMPCLESEFCTSYLKNLA